MLKELVVEDEEMIRKGIVLAVDWAALDCVVVGEAKDGRVRRIRPNARPRQMNATANNATKPTDDAQEP